MAQIIKEKQNNNESPLFREIKKTFRLVKIRLLNYVRILFLIFIPIIPPCILGFVPHVHPNIIKIILFSFIFTFKSLHDSIEEIIGLCSYQEYYDRSLNKDWKEKGDEGEYSFIKTTLKFLEDNDYKILNNIYLPSYTEYPLQIDSIIIGPSNNIYIVEIKNWYGLISGQIEEKTWFTKNGHLNSPYMQNKRHINTLKQELSKDLHLKLNLYNLVVNMDKNSYINICKYDKYNENIYDRPEELLNWILDNEMKSMKAPTSDQEKIIDHIIKIHYETLIQYEFKINEDLFKKYGLINEGDRTNQPQFV